MVRRIALAKPNISFSLSHNGKIVRQYRKVQDNSVEQQQNGLQPFAVMSLFNIQLILTGNTGICTYTAGLAHRLLPVCKTTFATAM